MKELIEGFPGQLRQAMKIGREAPLGKPQGAIQNVALLGLGGSAFGGEIAQAWIADQAVLPFTIHRHYQIPAHVRSGTLALLSSYSGNTEETLAAAEQAHQQSAQIVCISSGGELQAFANRHGYPFIQLPEGYPPRAACGFSLIQQLYILRHYGLIPDFEQALETAIDQLLHFTAHEQASQHAQQLAGRLPVIYSGEAYRPIAVRLRQQINENAKQLCWHHTLPEMNHNELVGWEHPTFLHDRLAVLLLRGPAEHPRVGTRFEILKDLLAPYEPRIVALQAQGENYLAQMLYLLHYCDWLSVYLAEANEVEATPVRVIDHLKSELKQR